MDRKQWLKIEVLLDEALSLPTLQEQQAFLKEKCRDDRMLYTEAWSLLQAIHEALKHNYLDD